MENNYFEEFVKNPFAQYYFRHSEGIICHTVTMISAVCEEIGHLNKKSSSKEVSQLLKYINYLCLNIMRLSDCNDTFLRMSGDSEEEIISLECFLKSFADNCNEVIGKVSPVSISGNACVKVKINKSLIIRSMLEFIRCYGLKYGRGTEFSIRYGVNDENIFIDLEIVKFGEPDEFSEKYDMNIFIKCCNEINRMFSKQSGMQYRYDGNSMKIVIPLSAVKEELELTDNYSIIDRREFSEYNTMLSDLL